MQVVYVEQNKFMGIKMGFVEYVRSLSPAERADYAERCGTTVNYINVHLIPATREPNKILRSKLITESNGRVSREAIIEHFGMFTDSVA